MSDLTAKAKLINGLIGDADSDAYSALEKVARAGAELLDIKDELPHGEFTPWVEKNIPKGIRQCQKYMKIARQGLPGKNAPGFVFELPKTINEAAGNPKKPKPAKPDLWTDDDDPNEDALAEALEEAGLPPMPKDGKLPSFAQAMVNTVDKKVLVDFTPAQKRRIRKHIKMEIAYGINKAAAEATREERQRLENLISDYGGRIEGSKEDVRTIRASLHPDRPDRTEVQLNNAMKAFQRLIGEMK